jgi:hypothetical protein
MLRGFVCLVLAAILMMSARGPDETLPQLRIEIMSIGADANPKCAASLECVQEHRRIASNGFESGWRSALPRHSLC